jgi:hypothetical protein
LENEAVQEILLSCLHYDKAKIDVDTLRALDTPSSERLYAMALRQGVAPLLYHRLQAQRADTALSKERVRPYKEAYLGTAARNLQGYRDLRELASALLAADIPIIVLKGVFLTEVVYRNPGVRPMVDMDLLVPQEHLATAAQILADGGFHTAKPLTADVIVQAVQHLPISTKSVAARAVEVHWSLTPPHQPYSVEVTEFWQRAIPATIAGLPLQALCPEDLLLHLCMHLAYMHEFACGLRPFCDVAATLNHYGEQLDWTAVVERASRWRWGRGVYLALYLAGEWLGAAVPASALAALRPADFDPSLCAAAREQVFNDVAQTQAEAPSTPFVSLWQPGRLGDKARIVRSRLLPPRAVLARRYGVRPGTPAFYGCYARLWLDQLSYYGPISRRLLRGDAQLSRFVRSRQALGKWLAEP